MLKIRFQRIGRKKSPFFRIVVAEHSRPVNGRFNEIIGHFNPASKELSLQKERLEHWISNGAQLSERVARIAVKEGIKNCEKFIGNRITKPTKAEREATEKAKKDAEEAKKAKASEPVAEAKEEKPAEVAEKVAEPTEPVAEAKEQQPTEVAEEKTEVASEEADNTNPKEESQN